MKALTHEHINEQDHNGQRKELRKKRHEPWMEVLWMKETYSGEMGVQVRHLISQEPERDTTVLQEQWLPLAKETRKAATLHQVREHTQRRMLRA
mmetsp:Transcript_50524/g.141455  ORF Transcript_50524/g.141455 Transcript_50524/m.141455 type:complete len:94 (-) Transcript_50524:413-694(-)|eukprot:CAMPEP_0117463606 /NCGR_PEP_ID=MMETSP0784-20121206/3664_1 /TAXON_ID=39447 /ORGANISM="" /LENGTH=93 /DNA_ID=CAMNT_0005257423 /DNA_START=581 /DNA_END=862 /DNA_ORIENTATION=-